MINKYNVTYTGKILAGFDEGLVKVQIAQLLKLSPEKVDAFFSGQKVTIKKRIDLESALKFQSALHAKGLVIQITEDRSNPPPVIATDEVADKPMFELVRDEPIPETKLAVSSSLQQRRAQVASGVAMPLAQTHPSSGQQQRALVSPASVWQDEEDDDDDQPAIALVPPFLGLSFDGRYGRLNFVNATSLFFVSLILLFVVLAYLPFTLSIFFIAPIYFFYRHLALRCHDLNLPSFAGLLIWVPYVNMVFLLALLIIPGKKGSNDYGPPSEQGPIWGLIGLGVISLGLIYVYMTLISTVMGAYQSFEEYEKNKIPAPDVALVAKLFMEHLLSGEYTEALALSSQQFQTLNGSSTLETNLDGFKFANKISKLKLNEAASEYDYFYGFENKDKLKFGGALMVLDGESTDYQPTQAAISILVINDNGAMKVHDVNFNEEYYYDDDTDYEGYDSYDDF